jgi:integrase
LVDAREAAQEALRGVQKGIDPAREKQRRREAATDTFVTVARLFVERHQRPKNRSWQETARLLGLVPDKKAADPKSQRAGDGAPLVAVKGGIVAKWADRKISEIRKADIIEVLEKIVDDAPYAANRTLAALRTLFNWAMGRDLIALSPCAGVKPPAVEKARDRVLSDNELKAVWKAAAEIERPFGPIVQLLILTGQRRTEVGGMTWDELDLDKKLWTLPRGRVKNDTGHEVPLSALALEIVSKVHRVKGCQFLFSTTGETPVSGYSKAKGALDEKTGLTDWRLHDLRRTTASGMARLGIALPVIEKVLNHSSGSFAGIVGVYQRHSFAEEKRAALDAWGRFVTSLIQDEPDDNVVRLRAVE